MRELQARAKNFCGEDHFAAGMRTFEFPFTSTHFRHLYRVHRNEARFNSQKRAG